MRSVLPSSTRWPGFRFSEWFTLKFSFKSAQQSKREQSPPACSLSLRRGVSWGRSHTLEHWPCGVCSIWLSTCEMFWLNVYVSHKLTVYVSICIYPKEAVFHFHLLPTFSWTIHLAWGLHCSACKSSHKTVFSQTFRPFLWDWGRRDQRCSPADTGTIILPTPPNISTWPGKARPVPEIGYVFTVLSEVIPVPSFYPLILCFVFLIQKGLYMLRIQDWSF